MADERVDMADSQGETAEVAVSSSVGEFEGILIFLTTVFLLLAIILSGTHLYNTYGLGKSDVQLKEEQKKIEENVRQEQQEHTVFDAPK